MGVAACSMDKHVQIGKNTAIGSPRKFVEAILVVFGDEYLRLPNIDDIASLLQVSSVCGFRGKFGSIASMH